MLTGQAAGARFWLADIHADLRQAVRAARSHPGLTAAIVLTTALGIGSTSAVFSLVNAVLVQPLSYPTPDRLMLVMATWRGRVPVPGMSAPEFFIWRRTTTAFEASAAYRVGGAMTLSRAGQLEQVNAARVSAGFFALFGARVARGRTFTPEEDRPDGPAVAVVSDGFWRMRMNAAADAVGRRLSLDAQTFEVIGVLAPDFDADALALSRSPQLDVWVPLQLDPASTSDAPFLAAARLRDGTPIDVARAQTEAASLAIRRALPEVMPEEAGLTIEPLHAVIVQEVRPALLLLLGAVALVLLIVCVNVAHLLLVRASSRQREMAIRLATGASRWRVVRQLLVESLLLSLAGGALGVYLAAAGLRTFVGGYADALPPVVAGTTGMWLDGRVLAFALLTSIVTGVLFGLAPALQSVRVDLEAVLRNGGQARMTSRRRLGGLFVVSEMALALMLLIGSALLVRSFMALRTVDPGFDGRDVLTMEMPLAGQRFASAAATARIVGESLQRVAAEPGVSAAAAALTGAPLSGVVSFLNVTVPGRSLGGPYFNGGYLSGWQVVSPGYFEALRIPLVAGRTFTAREDAAAAPVVVINERMARQFWPGESALGQYVRIGEGAGPEFEESRPRQIIGVVGDVRHVGLEFAPRPAAYVPLFQVPANQFSVLMKNGGRLTWVVRSHSDLNQLAGPLERDLRDASGGVAVAKVRSIPDLSRTSSASREFSMAVMVAFGLTAMALAALGVFGVMAHTVRERTREIGIRVALGAADRTIRNMVLGRGLRLSLAGIAAGTVASLGLAHLLQGLLFGVTARDWMTFLSMPFVLSIVARPPGYQRAVRRE